MNEAQVDANLIYLIEGKLLKALLKLPEGTKGQIKVRQGKDGEAIIGFAQTERFKVVRNGVIMVFEIPAQETD